jgi:CRP-like cAMP-binding protein
MKIRVQNMGEVRDKIPLFRGLSNDQVQAIVDVGNLIELEPGRMLCHEGDASTAFFIILAGSLRVRAGEISLGKIQAVDVVGEMGFITGMPRSATLEIETAARLIVIAKTEFDALLDGDDHMAAKIYHRLVDVLCRRLRESNVHLVRTQIKALGDLTLTI